MTFYFICPILLFGGSHPQHMQDNNCGIFSAMEYIIKKSVLFLIQEDFKLSNSLSNQQNGMCQSPIIPSLSMVAI